jgi:hypothetical protein
LVWETLVLMFMCMRSVVVPRKDTYLVPVPYMPTDLDDLVVVK